MVDEIRTEVNADGASLIASGGEGVHKSEVTGIVAEARHDEPDNSQPGTPPMNMNLSIGFGIGSSVVIGESGGILSCKEQLDTCEKENGHLKGEIAQMGKEDDEQVKRGISTSGRNGIFTPINI